MKQERLILDHVPCPTCGHIRKTYRRTIHAEMVKFMKKLASEGIGVDVNIRDKMRGSAKASTDASYLTHWGMVEKPQRGIYRLTKRGLDFICGRLSVPRYVLLEEGVKIGEEGNMSIRDVRGFDRDLLLSPQHVPNL